MSQAQVADRVEVRCACGKKLKAPVTAIGKKAKCPACGTVLTVTAPGAAAAAAAPPPPPPPPPHDSMAGLYELAKEERRATNVEELAPRCPQCVSPLAPDAAVCVTCGYNVKTGKRLQTAMADAKSAPKEKTGWFGGGGGSKASSSSSGKQVDDAMAPQGSFLAGLAGCAVGGVAGGVVWFLIAWLTGYELGFIALLVGALAGIGMQIGQKGYSTVGGVVASFVALVAIMLAKVAVIAAILMPVMEREDRMSEAGYDERVVEMLMEEELASKGLDYAETSVEQDEAAMEVVEKKLAAMSEAEREALVARAEEKEVKDELADYMTYEALEAMRIDPDDANETQEAMARKQAMQKIEAMTPSQRQAELKRLEAEAEAEFAKLIEEAGSEGAEGGFDPDAADDGPGVGLFAFGAGVLVYLLVGGWKGILFLVIAMSLAYKTAAGAVSD